MRVQTRPQNDRDLSTGYFLQEGDIVRGRYYKQGERNEFRQEIEQRLIKHPNSIYAESSRNSLAAFRANEAKRQKIAEKYGQKPNEE